MSDQGSKKNQQKNLINYYEILGIENPKTATQKDIKMKYTKLAIKYHPDKADPNNDSTKDLFELIQRAYDVLGNESVRREYDLLFNNIQTSKNSYIDLKNNFNKYNDILDNEDPSKKEHAKLEFERFMQEKSQTTEKINPVDPDDFKKLLENRSLQREQEEIEYEQNQVFTKDNFDIGKFNALFDQMKDKTNNTLTTWNEGPSAFNNNINTNKFTSLNEDDSNNLFNNFGIEVTNNKIDINKLNKASYVTSHNDKYSKEELENRVKQRELETSQLLKTKFSEFNNDKNSSYMFLHETGADSRLLVENETDSNIDALCSKLLELEN